MATQDKVSYLLRDHKSTKELERLNYQHDFFTSFGPPLLLHPTIPIEKLVRIADVATGTGIWLTDLANRLIGIPTASGDRRQYVGFDLSPTFFPVTAPAGLSFTTHNILTPFPEEHRGKYDLVHVRALVVALKKEELPGVVSNILGLLAPGGVIQWEEGRFSEMSRENDTLGMEGIQQDLQRWLASAGFDSDLAPQLQSSFSAEGLRHVTCEQFHSLRDEQTRDASEELSKGWMRMVTDAIWPMWLARDQDGRVRTAEEVGSLMEKYIAFREEWFSQGGYPGVPMDYVLGWSLVHTSS